MTIRNVRDEEFKKYGKVIEGYDFSELIETLEATTDKPSDGVIYVPGDARLEELKSAAEIRDGVYGGIPIQIGYCNGSNRALNCLEYHRGSELDIAADDIILLLAEARFIADNHIDTGLVEAFFAPRGTGVLLYETALHYAPCGAENDSPFRVVVVLPNGTNTDAPKIAINNEEDKLLWARNKWLIAHPDSSEAANGAYAGLDGENIVLR